MKVGDIIEVDGQRKRVVSFTAVLGVEYPNVEPVGEEKSEPKPEPKEIYTCQYCGKEITSQIGLASHERSCKQKGGK